VSRDVPDKAALVAALVDTMRELSTATILFHQAVADRLAMNVTDHKCAGILAQSGPITAGELAARTGLTTGAITGVIDRLEKAGFVRRARDAGDRRRVIVEPDLKQIERKIGPLFESMGRASALMFSGYGVKQLALIQDFAIRSLRLADEETRKLRDATALDARITTGDPIPAPIHPDDAPTPIRE
jgi:DNA-binding MarR family transcriptional regulator